MCLTYFIIFYVMILFNLQFIIEIIRYLAIIHCVSKRLIFKQVVSLDTPFPQDKDVSYYHVCYIDLQSYNSIIFTSFVFVLFMYKLYIFLNCKNPGRILLHFIL